jgi:hypothetical protein
VVDLANSGTVKPFASKVSSHIGAALSLISPVHERRSGRGAPGGLAVSPFEHHAPGSETVEIGGGANLVSIASKRAGLEIIRDEEEDVLDFGAGEGSPKGQARKEESEVTFHFSKASETGWVFQTFINAFGSSGRNTKQLEERGSFSGG